MALLTAEIYCTYIYVYICVDVLLTTCDFSQARPLQQVPQPRATTPHNRTYMMAGWPHQHGYRRCRQNSKQRQCSYRQFYTQCHKPSHNCRSASPTWIPPLSPRLWMQACPCPATRWVGLRRRGGALLCSAHITSLLREEVLFARRTAVIINPLAFAFCPLQVQFSLLDRRPLNRMIQF